MKKRAVSKTMQLSFVLIPFSNFYYCQANNSGVTTYFLFYIQNKQ